MFKKLSNSVIAFTPRYERVIYIRFNAFKSHTVVCPSAYSNYDALQTFREMLQYSQWHELNIIMRDFNFSMLYLRDIADSQVDLSGPSI